ncbi:hypothetical protein HPB50_008538 [Hyalomma asiaticum]|uniref:Uncharacterized protein n=1 Tax=Hyalomma asiaticum TaxID=266040 RepID=A0ACB7SJ27_HYAAI|nr:hypothetical protein HPB50_008538 [Hyalomma asiaticum]
MRPPKASRHPAPASSQFHKQTPTRQTKRQRKRKAGKTNSPRTDPGEVVSGGKKGPPAPRDQTMSSRITPASSARRFAQPTHDESELSHLLLKKRNYVHTVALIGCSLVSIAACVVILLLIPIHSNGPEVQVWSEDVCTTRACDRFAHLLRDTMEPSADTCREFGTLTCGHWTHDHAVAMDVDARLRESAFQRDAKFLSSYTGSSDVTRDAGRMLQSCLEQQYDQRVRQAALRTFLSFLRGRGISWPSEPTGDWQPFDVLLDLSINWRIDLWFGLRLRRNGLSRIQLREAPVALSVMVRAEHADELQAVAEIMLYAEAIGAGLRYTKQTAEVVSRTHSRVLRTLLNVSSLNPTLKRMRVAQLANLVEWAPAVTSSHWLKFLRKHLSGTMNVRSSTEVLIDSAEHFAAIGGLLTKFAANELVDVIGWWMVRLFADLGAVSVNQDLRAQAFPPTVCQRRVDACYGLALAAELAQQYWTSEHSKAVDDILSSVRQQAAILIQRLPWIDAISKKRIIRKLDALKLYLWPQSSDETALERAYNRFAMRESLYVERWLKAKTALRSLLGTEVGELLQRFPSTAWDALVEYDYWGNAVVVSMAALQEPLFSPSFTQAINYAGLGTMFARALVQVFDARVSLRLLLEGASETARHRVRSGSKIVGIHAVAQPHLLARDHDLPILNSATHDGGIVVTPPRSLATQKKAFATRLRQLHRTAFSPAWTSARLDSMAAAAAPQ